MIAILNNAAALFLMWLFVFSGLHKCRPENTEYYKQVVSAYGFGKLAEHASAIKALGTLEIATGIAVAIPASRQWGALIIALILFFYLVLIAVQLLNGRKEIECGCAGPLGGTKVGVELLVRNSVLFSLALCCLGFSSAGFSFSWGSADTVLIALAFASLLSLVYLCSEQLIANSQKLKTLSGR